LRPAARAVVLRRARRLGCAAWELGRDFDWKGRRDGTIAVEVPGLALDRLRVRRNGGFQRDNAAIALAASWLLASAEGIGPAVFTAAATKALPASRWPGRWCPLPLRKNAGAWVDGGHNPEAASALAREISGAPPWIGGRRLVALWSMLSDKDAAGYLRNLGRHLDGIVTYPLAHPRGAGREALAEACSKEGFSCRLAVDFPEGWRIARRWAGKEGVVLVCGSLAAAGDAYRHRVGFVP
jgi:dihydrofolate synthase/folylpolyglutamate synthase